MYVHMCSPICRVCATNNNGSHIYRSSQDQDKRSQQYHAPHRSSDTVISHHEVQRYRERPQRLGYSTSGLDRWSIDVASHVNVPTNLCLIAYTHCSPEHVSNLHSVHLWHKPYELGQWPKKQSLNMSRLKVRPAWQRVSQSILLSRIILHIEVIFGI